MMSEITQSGLRLIVLDFEVVCDEAVRHRLRSNQFGTQYVPAFTFGAQYIPSCTHGTY